MILAPSAIQMREGFAPSIILNGGAEYALPGPHYAEMWDALTAAMTAIEAIRCEMRAPLPVGWVW